MCCNHVAHGASTNANWMKGGGGSKYKEHKYKCTNKYKYKEHKYKCTNKYKYKFEKEYKYNLSAQLCTRYAWELHSDERVRQIGEAILQKIPEFYEILS